MGDKTYTPTEAQIQAVLGKYTPRQIAIAYLRANRRAQDESAAFKLMQGIQEMTIAAFKGDVSGAKAAVAKAKRAVSTHNQVVEPHNDH